MSGDRRASDAGDDLAAALSHISEGRLAEAESICQALRLREPNNAQVSHLLGAISLQHGDPESAIAHCRRAIALDPALTKALSNLGAALSLQGQVGEAIVTLQKAIELDPTLVSAHLNLGDAFIRTNRFDAALEVLEHAIALSPANPVVQINLGGVLAHQHRLDEAIDLLRRTVEQNPDLAQAHYNLGYAFQENREHKEAVRAFRRAQELNPHHATVYVSLGGAYHALAQYDDEIAAYDKALELKPNFSDVAFFRSLPLLALGRFEAGWQDYLDRESVRQAKHLLYRERLASDLTGVRLWLCKDQGLGDEIFFLRFAPELKRRGAHLTYQASTKIASLLRRFAALDAVVVEEPSPDDADHVVSVGDLPFMLAMKTAADVPPSIGLSPLPERLGALRSAVAALGPPPYIGVTWRAGTRSARSLFKSIPLDRLGGLLRGTKGTLIALQRVPEAGEIATLSASAGRPVHDLTTLNEDLEDMLALLSLLDEYVTVSNTNVHLRAAAGRGSRVLIPTPPDFRWMRDGARSPWFPECPVYRQEPDELSGCRALSACI